MKPKQAHVWEKAADGWYCEPEWVSRRLFEIENFTGPIYDPACGQGTILKTAAAVGYQVVGSDIVDRGVKPKKDFYKRDFLALKGRIYCSIVTNPPFDHVQEFCEQAVALDADKFAMICLVRRLNAAHWLQDLPLRRIWLLTPRPSMPPGEWIAAGNKPGGGTQDFCWLVFGAGTGPPVIDWLHRDRGK